MAYLKFFEFDEPAELLDFLSTAHCADAWVPHAHSHVEESKEGEFHGTETWEQAIDYARNGWSEGCDRMAKLVDSLTPYVRAAMPLASETLSVAGYAPNVPAYCAGSPACMYAEGEDLNGATPVVRILVNTGCVYTASPDSIFNRGAAIVACINFLELAGMSCELQLVSRASNSGDEYSGAIERRLFLKHAGDPLDIDRVAFYIANPSYHRRLMFALAETDDAVLRHVGRHYGTSCDVQPEHQQVYIPAVSAKNYTTFNRDCGTPEAAMQYVMTRIQESMNPQAFAMVSDEWQELFAQLRDY